jgi:CBS domain-containing protein
MQIRDFMTEGCRCIKAGQTLEEAARLMRDLDVGALPICGDDDRLQGMLTDRDIVVRCIADGISPADCTAGELAQGTPVWISADADCSDALSLMEEHAIKRLPVIDNRRLVGIVSQADVVQCVSESEAGELATALASASSNSGGESVSY